MAMKLLGIEREEMQVVFFDYQDAHKNLDGAWKHLFSPNHPILRVEDLKEMAKEGEYLCFRHAIFGLIGYLGFLHMSNHHPTKADECFNSELVQSFSNFVMSTYDGVIDFPPPEKPNIVLISRRNATRIFINEAEIVEMLKTIKKANVKVVDLAQISFEEQVRLMRNTSILIGVHGAGLTNLLYLPTQALVVELSTRGNNGFLDLYFKNMAQWANKAFVTFGSFKKFGPGIRPDVNEMKAFLEPLVRMSRQFYKNFEECGFSC